MKVNWNARWEASLFLLGKSWLTAIQLGAGLGIKPTAAWRILHAMELDHQLEKRLKKGVRHAYEWRLKP